jgi:hypothetical protein
MIKKLLTTLIAAVLLIAIVPLSSAASDGVQAYNGWVGSDSPLYGLKLLIEQIDESLAGDINAKLMKQMAHAETRLSEAYAMALKNNTGAAEAALNEYARTMGQINATMDDPGVDDGTYLNMSRQFEKYQNHFRYMVNNSTLTEQSRNRWANAFNYSEQFQNGRPFIYCNDTAYFVPPGQMQKMNWSQVPPGLGKKGFEVPSPAVISGKIVWPWDAEYNQSNDYNYSYQYDNCNGTGAEPYNNSFNNSYDYQSPGPHGTGNGTGNGIGNGIGNGNSNGIGNGNSNGIGNGKK